MFTHTLKRLALRTGPNLMMKTGAGSVLAGITACAASTAWAGAACASSTVAVPNTQTTGGTFGVDSRNYRDCPVDGSGSRYLHAMLRVNDLQLALEFFKPLGLVETRRTDVPAGRFTLVFLATAPGEPELELTWNYDGEEASKMAPSRNFGHLAFAVDDIYAVCRAFTAAGVTVLRPPRDGKMAFIKSPDGISLELLQKGEPLAPCEPWASMKNTGEW